MSLVIFEMFGWSCCVCTDLSSLFLKTIKDPTGRLFRWSLRLSAYDYEVKYLKGLRQYEANLLSRNPFCGFLSTSQIKDHQGELRRDTRYILNDKDLMTITRRGVTKIIVPPSLRGTLLQRAHRDFNHPGISQMTRLIAAQYYWDGMTNDIRTHPMDKEVIKNLNNFYRRFLVENILTGDSEALKIKLDVLQASRLFKKAWDQVTSETIKHCFKKAGFVKKEEDEENSDDIIAETMPSVDGWEDVISNPTISYDDFLNVDDDVAVCGEITDADIIAEVLNHNIEKQDGDEASGDEDESSVAGEMNVPSALKQRTISCNLDAFLKVKMTLNSRKQAKISDFFGKN
ncbi:hypothetical protein LAZ67_3003332 [Cordylochernes scorpioides]|uniref:RNA-directed DNA polymerase n=1 Tax=Cordylochernes scorpioides TaxID=51811 RepID=A0ABY6K8L6_9ARAC|nr:hypothetical protein LAZ67_3003332 [Cordylochernes scorpioides]